MLRLDQRFCLCFFIFTAFKNACTVIYFYKYVKWNDLNKLI